MPVAQTRLETLQICKLLQCVREEDTEQVDKLTKNGVPHLVNYNDPNQGDTALNIAAVANNEEMIEFLLNLGAHPDVVDFKGRSAAMRAAEYGHVQCVEKLDRADMKLRDLEGKSIINYCINSTQRHLKCLEIVLQRGADVNSRSNDGKPVFLVACETAKENEDMCLILLAKGADPNSKNEKTNRTALMAAAASGSAKVVKAILMRGGAVDTAMFRTKTTAAHEAAKGGFFDVLVLLAAFGTIFDVYDEQANNPIHVACHGGHDMCIRFLSQRGCNPKPKNADGNQPKGIAKDEGHKAAMKEARKAEKSFGKSGKNNEPWAIHLYDWVTARNEQLLDMFKRFDADGTGVIQKDDFKDGLQSLEAPLPDSPEELKRLLMSHEKNSTDEVDYNEFLGGKKYLNKLYLLSAFEGKKKKKKGGKGKKKKGKTKVAMPICTMADGPRAEDGGPPENFVHRHIHFTDTARFDRDAPPEHPLQDDSAWYIDHPEKTYVNISEASKYADFDSLRNAFNMGVHVDQRDKYHKTPLMVACSLGNLGVVKFLLEHGAEINAQDGYKWTPLHHACHAGQLDLVEYLLEQGSNMEAVTVNKATPLLRAIESSRLDVVQFLINKGAKIQVENRKGQNPVDVAAAWADPNVYDMVRLKWDSLPAPNDKKKGGKGGKKSATKRPNSNPPKEGGTAKMASGAARSDSPPLDLMPHHRKGSILRAASALATGIDEQEDITYCPLKVWTKQPNTQDLIRQRELNRERYGWEVDFPDFEMPFTKNVTKRVEEMGGADEDD